MSLKREWPHVLKATAAVPVLFSVLWLPLRSGGTEPFHLGLAELTTLAAVLALGAGGRLLIPGRMRSFVIALGFTILAAALSAGFSRDFDASVPALFNWLWLGGLALLSGFLSQDQRYAKLLVSALAAAAVIQASWSYFVWWGGGDAASTQSGTFYSPNQYAGYLLLLAPIALASALRTPQRREASAWGFLAVMLYSAVLLSGSRGGLAAALVGAVSLAAVLIRDKPRQTAVRLGLLSVGLFAAALFTSSRLLFPGSAPSAGVLTGVAEKRGSEVVSAFARIHWTQGALLIWGGAPLIGSGLGTYGDMLVQVQDPRWPWSRYAHNHYMEAFADGGILLGAGVIAISFVALAGRRARADGSLPPGWRAGIWGGLVGATAHLILDYDWVFPAYAATYVVAAALLNVSAGANSRTKVLSNRLQIVIGVLAAVSAVGVASSLVSLVMRQTAADASKADRLRASILLAPYSTAPRLQLASRLADSADPAGRAQASAMLEQAISLDELNPFPLWSLAELRVSAGDLDEARSLYALAMEIAPAAPRSYLDAARFELEHGDEPLRASAILDQGIQRLSLHPLARSRLASSLVEMLLVRSRAEEEFWGPERAIKFANQAADLAPSSVKARVRLAELSCRVGDTLMARNHAARLAVADPSATAKIPSQCGN